MLYKRRLQHRCFPVNFVEFSRTPLGDCFWHPPLYFFYYEYLLALCLPTRFTLALDSQAEKT